MVTRTTRTRVTFHRPFLLSRLDALQPAGTYSVETEEESLDALALPAWKPVAMAIQLFRAGATERHSVDPDELQEALLRDLAQPNLLAPGLESRRSQARRSMNALRRHEKQHMRIH